MVATQKTPQGETIPVPKRGDVFKDLRKVAKAKPPKESDDSDASAGSAEDQQSE